MFSPKVWEVLGNTANFMQPVGGKFTVFSDFTLTRCRKKTSTDVKLSLIVSAGHWSADNVEITGNTTKGIQTEFHIRTSIQRISQFPETICIPLRGMSPCPNRVYSKSQK